MIITPIKDYYRPLRRMGYLPMSDQELKTELRQAKEEGIIMYLDGYESHNRQSILRLEMEGNVALYRHTDGCIIVEDHKFKKWLAILTFGQWC